MPIYNGMLPIIDKSEVKRYAGLRHAEDFPQQFIDEACKEIQLLATPTGVYQEYDYDAESKTILSNPPLLVWHKKCKKSYLGFSRVFDIKFMLLGKLPPVREEWVAASFFC